MAFGKIADTCAKYLKKGRRVYVEGPLRTREFEEKNNAGKRYRTEIVAKRVQFLGPPETEEPEHNMVEDAATLADEVTC